MEVNFNFIYRIALLTLLAFKVQGIKEGYSCEEIGGSCVPQDSCEGSISLAICPNKGEVCCRKELSDECSNMRPPMECEEAYDGICQKDCEDGRIETGVCDGDCKCCGCKISDKCKMASGHCITRENRCRGDVIPELCDGEFCACCLSDQIEY